MFARNYTFIFVLIGLGLCSVFSSVLGACDRKSCPGPLYYYEELGCTPIFEPASSCCPTRYNCDVWKNLPADKCFVNGRRYDYNEYLPAKFTSDPCFHCRCYGNSFACSIPSCAGPAQRKPGCHYHFSSLECCKFHEICEDSPVACTVDGKSYKIGETFNPVAEPEKTCYCKKGYNGTNDDQYCVWRKPSWCNNVIRRIESIRENCAPVYAKSSALYKDCNDGHICQTSDTVQGSVLEGATDQTGESPSGTPESKETMMRCKFGNSFMNLGDKIFVNRKWGGTVSCTCEVPPIPTCFAIETSHDEVSEISF